MTRTSRGLGRFTVREAALAVFGLGVLVAAVLPPKAAAESETVAFEVEAALGTVFSSGDDAAFAQRHGVLPETTGGIERLYLERSFGDNGTLRMEGRAILNNNDYLLDLRFDEEGKGFVSAGYESFRTWDDDSGGFFPRDGGVFPEYIGDELELDRSKAWLHLGLRRHGLPTVDLRYRHESRDGEKSSLAWGETSLTGGYGERSIVPAFLDIDEKRDIVEASVQHTVAKTLLEGRVRYESSELDNRRNMRRNLQETGKDRFLSQTERSDSDLLQAYVSAKRAFIDDAVVLSSGYSYVDIQSDVSGSRIYGNGFGVGFDNTFANLQAQEYGFTNMSGSADSRRHLANLNLLVKPLEDLRVTTALEFENESYDSATVFTRTGLEPGTDPVVLETGAAAMSELDRQTLSESMELRYLGFDQVIVYAKADWEQRDSDLAETQSLGGSLDLFRDTGTDRNSQKYVVGATYYPFRRMNFSARYYYRKRENDYRHRSDSTDNLLGGDRYPAFIVSDSLESNGVDVRATWRVVSGLRLTARYDLETTTIDSKGGELAEIESSQSDSQLLGATLTWTPLSYFYMQADGAYADIETDVPADQLEGDVGRLVTDFSSDYWNANLSAALAVDDDTDLQARYYFFEAGNYRNNSGASQPFGSDSKESGVSVAINRRLSQSTSFKLRYGYFKRDDYESGRNNDYDAHLLSGRFDLVF